MTSGTEMVSLTDHEVHPEPSCQTDRQSEISLSIKDYLLGIILLLVVVVLWTSSNFVTQGLFVGGYHKPFLVTYLNTSSFALYLVPFLIRYWWRGHLRLDGASQGPGGRYEALSISEHDVTEDPPLHNAQVPYVPNDTHALREDDTLDPAQLPPLTTPETAQLAATFCFLWFIANWSLNVSLDYTSVASSTILSSTSGFFTLAIGRLFAVEFLNPTKIAAVITSFIGVLLVSLSDSSVPVRDTVVSTTFFANAQANPVLGDFLAILAAAFYALYVLLLKVRIHWESRIDMQLFFGFVGAFNIVALFPVGIILHLTGYEPFELPATGSSWGAVLVNMFITFSSDYIYVLAMLKTTPLVVTVGLSLTIPLAIIGDHILNIPTKAQAGVGALLVLGSFGLLGWETAETARQKSIRGGGMEEEDTPHDRRQSSIEIGNTGRQDPDT